MGPGKKNDPPLRGGAFFLPPMLAGSRDVLEGLTVAGFFLNIIVNEDTHARGFTGLARGLFGGGILPLHH